MAGYGPWIQDPDYEDVSAIDSTPMAASQRVGAEQYLDTGQVADWPDVYPDIPPMIEAANLALGPGDLAPRVNLRVTIDNSAQVSPSWVRKEVRVNVDFYSHAVNTMQAYTPTDVPADAIGIEWENGSTEWWQLPTVLSAHLWDGTELRADLWDSSVGGTVGPFTTRLMACAEVTYTTPNPFAGVTAWNPAVSTLVASLEGAGGAGVYTTPLAQPIDLTPHLDAAGRVLLFTTTDAFFGGPETDGTANDMALRVGWMLNKVQVRAMLRPMSYRFLYEEPPVELIVPPIRRTFPRPDGRAGGAPRTFPPSPTIQSGNRTSGAIF